MYNMKELLAPREVEKLGLAYHVLLLQLGLYFHS